MVSSQEKPVFLASYKGYYPLEKTIEMIEQLAEKAKTTDFDLYITVPLDYLPKLKEHFAQKPLHFGAEMMLSADDSSFTQSVAGRVLANLQCPFVLIGTTEERLILKTSDASLKKKVVAAVESSLCPIVAIGESLHEYEDGHSIEVMKKQLHEDLGGLSPDQLAKVQVLYDAPWIANSCWGDDSAYVPKAYANFVKAVEDFFGEKTASVPLYFSIPCFAEHLPKAPPKISCRGYYFGVMTPSHTVEPIHLYSHASSLAPAESPLQHLDVPDSTLPGR